MRLENWIHALVPVVGIIIAVISASLSYYFTKLNQQKSDERKLKEKFYLDYIKALSNNVMAGNPDETRGKLSDAHNHIILIGSSNVVNKLRDFSEFIAIPNRKHFTLERHDKLLTELLKSMRADLYKYKDVNKDYPIVALLGNRSRDDDL